MARYANSIIFHRDYEAGGELNIIDYLALAKSTLKNPACGSKGMQASFVFFITKLQKVCARI